MSKPTSPAYKTKIWAAYNEGLKWCGSLTIWFDSEMQWGANPSGKKGRSRTFSDFAIYTCLTKIYHAGLDVSLKEVSTCIVDDDGALVAQGTAPADPEGVAGWLKTRSLARKRIVHESGQLWSWLKRGMVQDGLPAICINARKAHKSLSAWLKKSDSADAEGLAQLALMAGLHTKRRDGQVACVGRGTGTTYPLA